MNEFAPLIDELYREEVLRAQQMSPEEKFTAGQELFELACAFTLAGIKADHRDETPERWQQLLRERIALGERLQWANAQGAA